MITPLRSAKQSVTTASTLLRSVTQRIASAADLLRRGVATSVNKAIGRSDHARWGDPRSLHADWDSRTRRIAELVDAGSSVIEFGAGRLVLRGCLKEGCTYTPSDIVDRGEGTIVCDLNARELPAFGSYDVAVFSGVLEYVLDVPRLIAHLSRRVKVIVASYAVTETNAKHRRAHGWMNDYSSGQLNAMFADQGFVCEHTERWKAQVIKKFRKS
jgi:hypothetical protein